MCAANGKGNTAGLWSPAGTEAATLLAEALLLLLLLLLLPVVHTQFRPVSRTSIACAPPVLDRDRRTVAGAFSMDEGRTTLALPASAAL